MKLGEHLIREGVLDPDQLKIALDAQLIFGGQLGTCLIERGFVTEAQLGHALASTFGVGYATVRMFEEIPPSVIATLPSRLVQKHMAIPIGLEDNVLDVAMSDPRNLAALDELSFAAGHKIRPWVSPEARIYQAMERYYDVPRRSRYLTLCDQMDSEPELEITPGFVDRRVIGSDTPGKSIYQSSRVRDVVSAEASAETQVDSSRVDELNASFCAAGTEDELASLTLAYAAEFMERVVLFRTRGGTVSVAHARGIDLDEQRIGALEFAIVSEPLLTLVRGEKYFRGPVPKELQDAPFFERLGLELPADMMLVPMYAEDRLVGLFYGDAGQINPIEGSIDDHLRVLNKHALALGMVRFKSQVQLV